MTLCASAMLLCICYVAVQYLRLLCSMYACFTIILWFCRSTGHSSNVINSARIIGNLFQNNRYIRFNRFQFGRIIGNVLSIIREAYPPNSTSKSQSMVASAINKRSKEQYKVSESKIKSNIAFVLTSAVNERQKHQ